MNLKISFNRKFKYIIISSIIILIGQSAKIMGLDVLTIVALALTAFTALMMNGNQLMILMLMLVAPNRILTYGPISAPTIVMMIGIFKGISYIRMMNKKFTLYSFLLVSISLATMFIGDAQVFDAIKIIIVLIFLMNYTEYNNIEEKYDVYVYYCSIGCILSALITLLVNPDSLRESSRFALSGNGENVLGILCGIMIINVMCIILQKRYSNNFELLIIASILALVGFLTGSRSFLLVIAIGGMSILFILIIKLNMKRLFKVIILLCVALVIALVLFSKSSFIQNYANQILYRITKLQSMDISNGRYALWEQYINVFHNNPIYLLFGCLDYGKFGIELVAHNMIIEQIASFGVISSAIIIVLYMTAYKYIKNKSVSKVMFSEMFAPMISLLCVSMVSHTLLGVPQTIMLYLSGLAILVRNGG